MPRKSRAAGTSNDVENQGRWVVAHDAWRDQYQMPAAFAEAGMLERFVTDWYSPLDRPLWSMAINSPLGRLATGLHTRFSPIVPSSMVKDDKAAFLASLLRRKWKHERFNDIAEGAKCGLRAAKLANATGSHLLAASYSAAAGFEALRPDLARVLFQVHPQPRFLRDLYLRQLTIDEDYQELRDEIEFSIDELSMAAWEKEAQLADHILCASSFTKRSLVWSGISPQRVSVVPYGVDTRHFSPAAAGKEKRFRVLFVGQRVARKGLRALLRAWSKLKPHNAELILAGGHVANERILQGFEGQYTHVPHVSKDALVRLYQTSDLFVLPSLAEGFGHVFLEALACGTPVLCTENTGAADLVKSGESGWVIPPGDRDALEFQLGWALNHRDEVRAMRSAARACAERYTWPRFRKTVRDFARRAADRIVAEAEAARVTGISTEERS